MENSSSLQRHSWFPGYVHLLSVLYTMTLPPPPPPPGGCTCQHMTVMTCWLNLV